MNWLYNTAINLYACGAKIAAIKSRKISQMIQGQKETLEKLPSLFKDGDNPIWIHAASLGEFEQGRTLIEQVKEKFPEKKILLTFFSPSGYEVRKNYDKVDAVAYLPFDKPENAAKFVECVKPSMAIFVKYEFWGNYIQTLRKHNIPVYIISAIFRPKQIFFRPGGGFMRDILRCYKHLFVQDQASAELLASIGIENVTVAGDTRFDRVTQIVSSPTPIAGIERLCGGKGVDIIFGSSWHADEIHYTAWLNSNPDVTFIIAPHEFNDHRLNLLKSSIKQGKILFLSEYEKIFTTTGKAPEVRGLIIDSFGKLSTIYRYGKIAYIGGGFGAGIHNINEAAVYGMPIVFGPKYSKFKEAKDLISLGGAFSVSSTSETAKTLTLLTTDHKHRTDAAEIARAYIKRNLGATNIIFKHIFGV